MQGRRRGGGRRRNEPPSDPRTELFDAEQEAIDPFADRRPEPDDIFASDRQRHERIFEPDELLGEPFAEDAPAQPRPAPRERPRRGLRGETARRVFWALPWVAFAITIVALGGLVFTIALVGLGVVGLREYYLMTGRLRPVAAAGFLAVPGMILAAHFGTAFNVLLVGTAAFPLIFIFGARRRSREGITISMGITVLGVLWIGLPFVHAVLLRDLPLHGGALLIDVLIGTFATDTSAYAAGRLFGSRKITPRLSPNKTLEGLVGGFIGGTMAFWFAGLYQDWLTGVEALAMGAAVAALAPLGDLFESMVKRDLRIKDTGSIFGPHGGLLDRLDAVFFTVVAGYYLSVAFVY